MQFQVPQFIETEDKIVGPLTLKQFLYIAAAGGLSLMFYFVLQTWLWVIFSVIVVGAAAGLAFVKINGRPLSKILLASIHFYWQPQTYVWQPEHPQMPKNESTLRSAVGSSFSLESIVSGLALKHAAERVLTGSAPETKKIGTLTGRAKEKYEVIQRASGERSAARRIDYR